MSVRSSAGFDWLNGDVSELRERYERLYRVTDGGRSRWETVEHQGHRIRCLVQQPSRSASQDRAIVYFHGGGWIVGSPLTHADISRALCEQTGLRVFSVDYRLAPDHRVPAPVEDGLAVLAQVPMKSAVLCGDSAGAAIALAVERRADRGARSKILGVCGFYGFFGVFDSDSLRLKGSREDGLDRACVERMWTLANVPGEESPYSIEALASESDIPAYLLAASEDPALDNTLELAARFQQLHRPHVLEVAAGEKHGFLHGIGQSAADHVARVGAWIDRLRCPGRGSQRNP